MIKRIFTNLILLIVTIAVTLFALDLAIQAYFKIPSKFLPKIVRFAPELTPAKRLRPNLNATFYGAYREFRFHVDTDQEGFRLNSALGTRKGGPEIIFLGDSQTFGVGVNDQETFPAVFETLSKKQTLNTGCPGYNNIEESLLLKELLREKKPKLVVLCFFAGNDPYENSKNRSALLKSSKPNLPVVAVPKRSCKLSLSSAKEFLVKNSAIYNCLIRLRRYEGINQLFLKLGMVNEAVPAELVTFRKGKTDTQKSYWQITDQAIRGIQDEAVKNGAQFLVLFLPDRYQVDSAYWNLWLQKYSLRAEDFDLELPNKHLRLFCADNRISFLDVTEALRKAQREKERVYWEIDNHLAPQGNRIIADELFRFLGNLQTVSE